MFGQDANPLLFEVMLCGSGTVLSVGCALDVHGQICACGRRAAGELKRGGVKNKSSSRRL